MTRSSPRLPRGKFVRRRRPRGEPLPGDRHGVLVGLYHHQTLVPQGNFGPDDNHVYLWVRVPDSPEHPGGVYECAFNIHSRVGSMVEFAEMEEDLGDAELPEPGFYFEPLSYSDLGLTDDDFAPTRNGDLHVLVSQYAERCERIAAFGITYEDGSGLHDIHMMHGEPRQSRFYDRNCTDRDGALIFYFRRTYQGASQLYARWVCIKFASQKMCRR